MSRSVFAPGIDRESASGETPGGYAPGRGAGGVFAKILQGATPKYAVNNGARTDLFRDTMARMYVRIDAAEMDLFLGSVGDSHTRDQLTRRLVGDPTPPQQRPNANTGNAPNQRAQRITRADTNGYLDFFIQTVQMSVQEKVQVSETLSDNYVAYAFGQAPPVWNFSGSLLNSVQDDQASNMYRLYTEILRATQLARRQKSLSISFDSYVVNGVMMNMNLGVNSGNELLVPFSFQLLVKRVFIVNYTSGWVPTTAGTPFAADPLARDYDGAPRQDGVLTETTLRIPEGVGELPPVPDRTDPRASVSPVIAPPPPPPPPTPPAPRTPLDIANSAVQTAQTQLDESVAQANRLTTEFERLRDNPTLRERFSLTRRQDVARASRLRQEAEARVERDTANLAFQVSQVNAARNATEQAAASANPTGSSSATTP